MAKKMVSPRDTLEQAMVLEKQGKDYFAQASGHADNELAKRMFQAVAGRHERHADRMDLLTRALDRHASPEIEPAAGRLFFEEIMRRIEQSTGPTARTMAELRDAIVYATKLRDVYAHLAQTTTLDWETRLYGVLRDEEEGLRLTLSDTLNYLRSNFDLSQLPKAQT
ncbi:MAG TPA: hypothetical protein VM223_24880 [Planctomycetota bacterium]|nr:hypothetical protein [Planctomycetota bacterium]